MARPVCLVYTGFYTFPSKGRCEVLLVNPTDQLKPNKCPSLNGFMHCIPIVNKGILPLLRDGGCSNASSDTAQLDAHAWAHEQGSAKRQRMGYISRNL